MKIVQLKNGKLGEKELQFVLNELMAGEVVCHATETCYGLAADPFSAEALEKLYNIKKMALDKPVSIMVSDLKMAEGFAEFNEFSRLISKKYWPGPLTILLKRKIALPDFFNPSAEFVGIRCPDDKFCLDLIKRYGGPLTTTSANLTGKPQAYSVEDFIDQVKGCDYLPSVIIDSGRISANPPSTIIKIEGEKFSYIREGAVKVEGF